jgi:hypothetical protein
VVGPRCSHRLVAMLAAMWRHSGGPRRQSIMIRIALPSASGKPWTTEVVRTVIAGGAAGGVMRTAIAALLLLLPVAADAATIEVVPLKDKQFRSIITITGKINDGDHRAFRDKLSSAPQPAIVAFNSPGGHLIAGLNIGEQIKAAGLATLVPSMMTCASACALAWLAGSPRYMQGKVGFHAVFNEKDHEISSVGNAVTGAYLNKLGLQYPAIVFITTAPPSTVEWLTKARAMNVGIVFNGDDPTSAPAVKEAAAPAIKEENWRPLGFAPRDVAKTAVTDTAPVPNSGSKHDKLAVQLPQEVPKVRVHLDGSAPPQRDVPGGPLPTWSISTTGKFDKAVP